VLNLELNIKTFETDYTLKLYVCHSFIIVYRYFQFCNSFYYITMLLLVVVIAPIYTILMATATVRMALQAKTL